jgi:hypothetical protein
MIKSKKISPDERTTVGIKTEFIDLNNLRRGTREYLQIVTRMDGALEGLTARTRVDLVDGELLVHSINMTADRPMPLSRTGSAAMRDLRFREILWIVEQCLSNLHDTDELLASQTLPYLTAVRSHKRRPGRRGTPDIIWADIARKRMEAEEKSHPGKAIRYMVKMWPDDFVSIKAADAKVHRARRKGMLEGRGKTLQLTDKAKQLLEGKQP